MIQLQGLLAIPGGADARPEDAGQQYNRVSRILVIVNDQNTDSVGIAGAHGSLMAG
jgi:hypothetical protein